MYTILEFINEQDGISLIAKCSINANLNGNITSSLTQLSTNNFTFKKWCFKSDLIDVNSCAGNEALNIDEINQCKLNEKCIELEKTEIQLIDEGYFISNQF